MVIETVLVLCACCGCAKVIAALGSAGRWLVFPSPPCVRPSKRVITRAGLPLAAHAAVC